MILNRKRIQQCIFVFDFVLLSLFLALFIRKLEFPTAAFYLQHIPLFIPSFLCWLICMYVMNLYSIDTYKPIYKTISLLIIAFTISTLIGLSSFYLFGNKITPKTVMLLQNGIFLVLTFLWHIISKKLFSNRYTHSNYAFIGYNQTVTELLSLTNVSVGRK